MVLSRLLPEAKLRRTDLVSPPTKRRHPVSKKGISKKSSSKVLLKKESHKSTGMQTKYLAIDVDPC